MEKLDGTDLVDLGAGHMTTRPGPRVRRSGALLAVLLGGVLVSVLALGVVLTPGAIALTSHEFKSSFGEPGNGAGQLAMEFFSGAAVDEATHDVYVADSSNHRISEFSQSGAFIRAFGADVGGPGVNVCTVVCGEGTLSSNPGGLEFPGSLAIDNSAGSEGDVYVADLGDSKVTKFKADGSLVSSWGTSGQLAGPGGGEVFGQIGGVAVNSAGDLLVMSTEAQFFKFAPDGTFLTSFRSSTEHDEAAEDGLTVDPADNLFKITGSTEGPVEKLDPTGADLGRVANSASAGIAADPLNADLYVDNSRTKIDEYAFNSFGEVVQPSPPCPVKPKGSCPPTVSFGSGDLSFAGLLAVDGGTKTIYAVDFGAQSIVAFGPVILPDAATEQATAITKDSALLHGTTGAAGGPETRCEFQITTEASFNKKGFTGATSLDCTPAGPFTGASDEAVSAEATELSIGTGYVFRVLAESENGTYPDPASKAGAVSFRTSGPKIVSSTVSDITATGGMISGVIETNGEPTTYRVEYGPTESYGFSQPIPDASAVLPIGKATFQEKSKVVELTETSQGAFVVGQEIRGEGIPAATTITKIESRLVSLVGVQEERLFLTLSKETSFATFETALTSRTAAVSQRLTALTPGTLYHFRISATGVGTTVTPDVTFSTLAAGAGSVGRTYELVSPVAKLGEPIPPEPGAGFSRPCGIECAPGVNWIQMPMQASPDGEAVSFEGQPFSPGLASSGNEYIAHRSTSGWSSESVTPPQAGASTSPLENGFKAFSADLSRGVLFQTSPALSPEVPPSGGKASYNDLYLWEAGNPNLRPLVTVKPPQRSPGEPQGFGNQFELSFSDGNSGGSGVLPFSHLVFEANDSLTAAVPGVAPVAPEVNAGKCGGFPVFSSPESDCNLYEWVGGQLRLINVLPGNEAAATHATIGSGRSLTESLASVGEPVTQAPDVDHAISADGSRIFWSDETGQVYVRIDGRETVKVEDPGRFLTASTDGSKVLLTDGCVYSLQSKSCEVTLGNSGSAFLGTLGASDDLSRIYFIDTEALAPGAESESCEPLGEEQAGEGCNLYVFAHGEVTFIARLIGRDNNLSGFPGYGTWKASPSGRVAQVTPDGRYLTFMSSARLGEYDNRLAGGGECSTAGPSCSEVYEFDLASHTLHCVSCNPSGQRPIGNSTLTLIRPQPGVPFEQPELLPAEGEGRLFFESHDTLLPADTDGRVTDVYEWTPDGIGGCGQGQGCLALISSGHSPNDSNFITSTPNGKNAFFITRERLVPQDQDELLDVYDARVGGGFEVATSSSCAAEGCRAPIGSPPPQPAAASSGFSGAGNQKASCKRGYVRKHDKCVKQKKHKQKKRPRGNRRAANDSRGGSK